MRKIHKILATAAISLGLFLGFEQKETQAMIIPGINVMDLSNLFQAAAQMLQDADLGGLFSQISDLEMKTQKFNEWRDQFRKFTMMYNTIQKSARYAAEITSILAYFVQEVDFLYSSYIWFSSNGATPEIVLAAANCASGFQDSFKSLQEDNKTRLDFVQSLQSGDALVILDSLDKLMKDYQREFYANSSYYRSEVSRLYYRHRRLQADAANMQFFANRLFY